MTEEFGVAHQRRTLHCYFDACDYDTRELALLHIRLKLVEPHRFLVALLELRERGWLHDGHLRHLRLFDRSTLQLIILDLKLIVLLNLNLIFHLSGCCLLLYRWPDVQLGVLIVFFIQQCFRFVQVWFNQQGMLHRGLYPLLLPSMRFLESCVLIPSSAAPELRRGVP